MSFVVRERQWHGDMFLYCPMPRVHGSWRHEAEGVVSIPKPKPSFVPFFSRESSQQCIGSNPKLAPQSTAGFLRCCSSRVSGVVDPDVGSYLHIIQTSAVFRRREQQHRSIGRVVSLFCVTDTTAKCGPRPRPNSCVKNTPGIAVVASILHGVHAFVRVNGLVATVPLCRPGRTTVQYCTSR